VSSEAKQRDWDPTLTRPAVVTFVALVALFATALMVLGALWAGQPDDWFAVVVLAVLAAAGALVRETYVGSRVRLSFISIILAAAAVIVGPLGAGIVGAVAMTVKLDGSPLVVRTFNVSMMSSVGSAGGLVYLLAGGRELITSDMSAGGIVVGVGLPMIVTDVAQCLLNALLISSVLRVSGGQPIRPQVVKLLTTSGAAYIGYGVIGFLLVVLWLPARVGWFAGVLVLAPLLVARWGFDQYGEELKAHERTLRALVTAEEKKEPHNAGHSDRVAALSEWLAQALGLGHKEVQDIRTAGMLHDIGKIAVPSRLLRGRLALSDEDLVVVAGHARAGVAVVEGIDFLRGSLDGIAHHHERFDGLGYPAGLRGTDIPLSARIVAVADAFDALTTPRAYRDALPVEEALRVITERAGTQFDPLVCGVLPKVLTRHEWTVREPVPEHLALAGVTIDHDEPEVSDRLAARPELRARIDGAASPVGTRQVSHR
jgi:hypothetical protein